ncbi:class I adenylate-forming enzyme family protein [Cytobacillus purgationiresistens]|uniref:Feruloyl-CoA synthase n=1 Tax=Cytobacillus purgationiresistens TaxID=863449 RepID=A0ABU0AN96_9BACI|nr:long-chain-fatty-acid--CoA ligase [Cytobacillus purgationiresistens]MDQ0272759.1 feruloyl-CoA synthase [Cytobacillus purgationiresistens]
MNSSQLITRNARKYPNTEAIISSQGHYTYAQLEQKINQFAHALRNSGVVQGDRVCLYMPNTPEFVISYFAIQRIGGIVVPVNAKFKLDEVQFVINHAEAKCLIVHEMSFPAVEAIEKVDVKIKTGESIDGWNGFELLIESSSDDEINCLADEDDLSTILYTSGTTGDPKGVLFSYRNILTVAQMIAVEMEVKPESRMLIMMPLTHSAPLHLFLMAGMVVGASVVLTPTFTPDLLLKAVSFYKTTHFFGAPVAYLLTAAQPALKDHDLSSMKWWVYGGAPLAKEQIEFISQQFCTDRLTCVYGLTEAGPSGSILLPEEHGEKTGSIGKRAPLHTELRIVDEYGENVPVGEVGEIVLLGEGNMVGYYKDEELTKETYIGKWLKTGDLARRDEDGYLWVVDRKKDVIISGGVNIYPKEIEDLLVKYEGIQEAAVVGMPHEEWGETVIAFFVASEKVEPEALSSYLRLHIAKYKIPRVFEQVDMLPRNASGKILKRALKERVNQA